MAFKEARKKSTYETQTWDKVSNPVIEGKYVEYNQNVMNKPNSNIYVIENVDGKWAVWSSVILDGYFADIQIGSLVRVTFLGKKKGKGGNQYNDYRVDVDVEETSEMPF